MSHDKFELLRKFTEDLVTFNKILGLRLVEAGEGTAKIRFEFKPELVGNFILKILHGGVIASALDVVGACAIMTTYLDQGDMHGMGTVDMRVDYLNPGKGAWFIATGTVMRGGRILSSTRMELHNDQGELIAAGTAVYRISRKEEKVFMNV